jgi:GNAT superfamily N-acetyltransferase
MRRATADDHPFLVEMARYAGTLEDRPLPEPDDPDVLGLLPGPDDAAVVLDGLGAAWWRTVNDPLLGRPELSIALVPNARGAGHGRALLEALADEAQQRGLPALSLNVHLRNTPALHLYMRCGFRVAGAGRGWYGVAMLREL